MKKSKGQIDHVLLADLTSAVLRPGPSLCPRRERGQTAPREPRGQDGPARKRQNARQENWVPAQLSNPLGPFALLDIGR
jgi:hypothetical protein